MGAGRGQYIPSAHQTGNSGYDVDTSWRVMWKIGSFQGGITFGVMVKRINYGSVLQGKNKKPRGL